MDTGKAKEAFEGMVVKVEDAVRTNYRRVKNFITLRLGTETPPRGTSSATSSPNRGERMTLIDRRPSRVRAPSPNEPRAGTSGDSNRRDSDLISTATSALRRLNFRSGKGNQQKKVTSGENTPEPRSSSLTSDTTNNTSMESSTTVYTTVTVTDIDQEEKSDTDLFESKPFSEDEKLPVEIKPEIKPQESSDDFDDLYPQSEESVTLEEPKPKATKKGKSPKKTGEGKHQGYFGRKKGVTTITVHNNGVLKQVDWPPKKLKQTTFEQDKQKRLAKMRESFSRAASWEQEDDEMLSSIEEKVALVPGALPPPPLSAVFPMMDEETFGYGTFPRKKMDDEKPKTSIKVIQSGLPQRTIGTNFNKRKKMDREERRASQAEPDRMSYRYSQSTSPKTMDETRFPFPPRTASPMPRSISPRLRREMSTSLKKLSGPASAPINIYPNRGQLKTATHAAATFANLEEYKRDNSQEAQNYRYSFGSAFNMYSPTNLINSPTSDIHSNRNASSYEYLNITSPTEIPFMCDDFEDEGREDVPSQAAGPSTESPMSSKRKKHDQKSSTPDQLIDFYNFVQERAPYLTSTFELNQSMLQSRKYSILSPDGSVKNFVSEDSEEYKKAGENVDKENINKNAGPSTSGEYSQKNRKFSVVQSATQRRYVFDLDPADRPSKQRKVIQGKMVEDTPRNLPWEDVHPRKPSLTFADTTMGPNEGESPRKSSIVPDDKPRKFSTNTLGDIVSARKFSLLPPGEFYSSVDGKKTEIIKLPQVSKGKPLATIVVQQASIQRGSVSGPSGQKEEDSYLDVSNSFTYEESAEFELQGTPHHSRSQSVKIPGRSGRPNYLSLPQQRARVASMPNTGVEEEYYRLRHFSITCKGLVNRGDSLKSRRSKSINSVASSNSSYSADYPGAHRVGSYPGSARNSGECSLASSRDSSTASLPYKVVILGGPGVGKTSLISQFMTSEYLQVYDLSLDEEYEEKSISVMLDEEESELTFIDNPLADMSIESVITTYQPHAYIIVYSVVDRDSFEVADQILQSLWRSDSIRSKAVILVGNKGDLARSRTVAYNAGIRKADEYNCKFIETSVGINHNVDELLAGVLQQIRLKHKKATKRNICAFGRDISPLRWRNPRLSASLRIRGLIGRVWTREDDEELSEQEKIQLRIYQEQWFQDKEVSKRKLSEMFCCMSKKQRYSI